MLSQWVPTVASQQQVFSYSPAGALLCSGSPVSGGVPPGSPASPQCEQHAREFN